MCRRVDLRAVQRSICRNPYIAQGLLRVLADSGATTTCVSEAAISEGRLQVVRFEQVRVQVRMADASFVKVRRAAVFKLYDEDRRVQEVRGLCLPQLPECDVLLGMDVLGNARTTTFDWYGRRLILETETGRVRFRLLTKRERRSEIRLMKDTVFEKGVNFISQEELGVYLSNCLIASDPTGKVRVARQYFDIHSNDDVMIEVEKRIKVPAGTRIAPVETISQEERAARICPEEIIREVVAAVQVEQQDPCDTGTQHRQPADGDDGEQFDYPQGPARARQPQPTWRSLLGRDPSKDPGYEPATGERMKQLKEELQLDQKTYFSKIFSPRQRVRAMSIIRRYSHVWKTIVTPIPRSVAEHVIDTGDQPPPYTRQYPLNQWQKEGVRQMVKELLSQGLIQESTSPYCSPLLVVPKPDGSPRVCFDARKLNAITKKDRYPVPNVTECLNRLSGACIFSTGDALSGFWQILLRIEDRIKTAFATEDGLFEFVVMPFGLCNAPSTFCRAMDKIMGGLRTLFVVLYVDDWMIPTKAERGIDVIDLHLDQLEAALAKFSIAGMSLKAKKTYLFELRVKFLGHIVSEKGREPAPDTVSVIKEAQPPRTKSAIKSWTGAVGYYRHFVPQLAKKLKPINDLTRDGVRFGPSTANRLWTKQHQKLFQEIKDALTSNPILCHPDFAKPFEIHTDGSVSGIGATLIQHDNEGRERVVEYASRGLTPAESRYETRELECLALIFAIRKFHRYLGQSFTAVVDHKNLLSLQSYVKHNRRLQRWAIELSQYGITMKHKKGEEHVMADLCSRLPEFNTERLQATPAPVIGQVLTGKITTEMARQQEANEIFKELEGRLGELALDDNVTIRVVSSKMEGKETEETELTSKGQEEEADVVPGAQLQTLPTRIKFSNPVVTLDELRQAQIEDDAWNRIRVDISSKRRQCKHSYLYDLDENDILVFTGTYIYHKTREERKHGRRIVVPKRVRRRLIWNFHNTIEAGHTGHMNVFEKISERFCWPGMFGDIKREIQSCPQCRKAKLTNSSRLDRLKTILTQLPFEILYVDHVEIPAKNSGNYTHIITMMDGFSRFLVAEVVRSTESRVTCKVVWDRIVCGLGRIPGVIVCDNGFDSDEWKAFCRDLGSKPAVTAPYNPRANRVERTHRFLKALLRIATENMGQATWPQLVQTAVRAYNAQRGKKGLSPFEILFGFQPDFPIENILFRVKRWGKLWDENKYFSELVHQIRNNHRKAKILDTKHADERIYREIRNPKRFAPGFEINDLVLWRQSRVGSRRQGTATKLYYQCTGPHRIVGKKENHDLYAIELGNSGIRKEWIPGEHLAAIPARIESTVTKPRNTNWMIDGDNRIMTEHNVGDIVAIKFKQRPGLEPKMNVRVGEIVKISPQNERKPVTIHIYGPFPRRNLTGSAHTAGWSPLIATEEGEQLAKDIRGTRRSRKGKRVLLEQEFSDLMPIPPLELNQGHISAEGKRNIRRFIKQEQENRVGKSSTGTDTIRAVRTSTQHEINERARERTKRWAQWLAHQIRAGIEDGKEIYDNEYYIRTAFSWKGEQYVVPKQQQQRRNKTKQKKT